MFRRWQSERKPERPGPTEEVDGEESPGLAGASGLADAAAGAIINPDDFT